MEVKEIKEHEIQVEVKELEQKGPYVMQCGSFKTHQQAETLKAKIAFAGLITKIKKTTGTNKVANICLNLTNRAIPSFFSSSFS